MRIDKLYLQNFRCYDELKLEFDKNMTVIVGENGKGKTAILDALAISLEPYLRAFGCKGRNMGERDVRRIKDAGDESITRILRMKSKYPVTIKVEGENDEMRVNTSGGMDYIRSAWENELNPLHKDVEISGSRYFEGYSEQNKVTLQYRLPNVLSAKYQVAMIIVPKNITNHVIILQVYLLLSLHNLY